MKRYTVVTRPDAASEKLEMRIIEALSHHEYQRDEMNPDIVFVVGGDGTFIYAVHQFEQQLDHIQFYGIHTGTLGFYTDYQEEDVELFLNDLFEEKLREQNYPLLRVQTEKESYLALNEMRIENARRTQTLDIFIDDLFFETYRGTGINVSTQLGSTAYNRSLGGAVIQDGLGVIEMCEIAGIHHQAYRSLGSPFILRRDTKLKFEAVNFEGALLGIDAKVYDLKDTHTILVQTDPKISVRMLKGRNVSYLERLHSLF